MLNQRQSLIFVPMIVALIAASVIGFLVIRLLTSQVSLPDVGGLTITSESTYVNLAEQNRVMAEYLKFNHSTNSLTPNWGIYAASLNYADYPSVPKMPGETAVRSRPAVQKTTGATPYMHVYAASLNYADYPSVPETPGETAVRSQSTVQETTGAAPYMHVYAASSNNTDYPSVSLKNQEMAAYLARNHTTSGLAPNWREYMASLNWADFAEPDLPPPLPDQASDF